MYSYFYDETLAAHDPTASLPTAIAETSSTNLPQRHTLEQNFPNPFNGSTAIRFTLGEAQYVELSVYNLSGQRVTTLVQSTESAGTHTIQWNGRDGRGHDLASGAFFYRLRADEWQETRRLLLLR